MNDHLCEQCGAENAPDAQFCLKCDFYLGWDTGGGSLGGAPLTSGIPVVRETHTQKLPAASMGAARPPARPPLVPPQGRRPAPRHPVGAPEVTVQTPEVVVDEDEGGTFEISIRNVSSVVDGYTVSAPEAPPWLEIAHPEIRLMTKQDDRFAVALRVRPGWFVNVQRFRLPVVIASVEDPARRRDVELVVTVPRKGGPVVLTAEPAVVRLRDVPSGRLRIRLDNKGSNYPQRFRLIGSDTESVVRFSFRPAVVEVPPRQAQLVEAQFDSPPPQPGEQANRTLTITAASDGDSVQTTVNVVHLTSQAPPDSPVQLRLEPRVVRLRDSTSAEFSLVVDNRRGSRDRRLFFSGRDMEGRVRFAFSQPQLFVRAGDQARIRMHTESPLPTAGRQVEHAITVVCNDGVVESEAAGSVFQEASASPITTAKLRLEPEHVSVRNRRRGRLRLTLDNTRGALPLGVWLSGSDPEGAVRFTFTPSRLDVAPGTVGRAALDVWSALPGSGQEAVHEITVAADDGAGRVEAQGRFTQSMSEILPAFRLLLTLLGGLLIALGAIRPWFLGGPTYDVSRLTDLQQILDVDTLGELENIQKMEAISQPAARALMLVLAGIMLLGILSARGRFTILAGFLAGMLTIGYLAYAMSEFHSAGPAYGAILVVAGAVAGIAGGFCVKR